MIQFRGQKYIVSYAGWLIVLDHKTDSCTVVKRIGHDWISKIISLELFKSSLESMSHLTNLISKQGRKSQECTLGKKNIKKQH